MNTMLKPFRRPLAGIFNALYAIDTWLLLRYPRVWQTRLHLVLAFALLAYPPLLAFSLLLLRPVAHGPPATEWSGLFVKTGAMLPSASDLTLNTSMLQAYVNMVSVRIGLVGSMACVMAMLLFTFPSVLLFQIQGHYNLEKSRGKRSFLGGTVEWLCYALSGAMLAGLVLVPMLCLSPSPEQQRAAQRIDAISKSTADVLSATLSPADRWPLSGRYHYSEIMRNTNPEYSYFEQYYELDFLPPQNLERVISLHTPITSSLYAPVTYTWSIAPVLSDQQRQYLSDLYGHMVTRRSIWSQSPNSADNYEFSILFARQGFWWIVGFSALMLFLRSRAPRGMVVGASVLYVLLSPITSLAKTIYDSNSRFAGFSDMANFYIGSLLVLGPLFVFSLFCMLRGLFGRTQTRLVLFGLVAFPFILAHLPSVLLDQFAQDMSLDYSDRWMQHQNEVQYYRTLVSRLTPFLYVPLLPIWDWALARMNQLPDAN